MTNKTINEQRIKDNTTHFELGEFECKCGGKYCDGSPDTMNIELLKYLEQIRTHFGDKPVHITSGLRCPTHNKNEGGVANSNHLYGLAVDFYIDGISADKVLDYVKILPNYNYAYKIVDNVVHFDVKYVSDINDGNKITVDGVLGKETIKALQKSLGVAQDGVLGKVSITALQEWLNGGK